MFTINPKVCQIEVMTNTIRPLPAGLLDGKDGGAFLANDTTHLAMRNIYHRQYLLLLGHLHIA